MHHSMSAFSELGVLLGIYTLTDLYFHSLFACPGLIQQRMVGSGILVTELPEVLTVLLVMLRPKSV